MAAITFDGLTKRYGDGDDAVLAVDGLHLTVADGEVFGFLGPNGAGKTTTINVMLDFAKPTAGSTTVLGHDAQREPVAVRRRTGLLLEGRGVYPRLTGREHVEHAVATKDADDDVDALLARVGLTDAADRPAGGYSRGMRQRLSLAVALVGDPDLLVMDEPSAGLDPNGTRMLREVVRESAADGTTVFFSSHVLEEVGAVADRVGILLDGQLATAGTVADLRGDLGGSGRLFVTVERVTEGLEASLAAVPGVGEVDANDRRVRVTCADGAAKLAALNRVAGVTDLVDFSTEEASLDEVFSRYTGAA